MRSSKHGLKALGLTLLVALGLMAFFASAAQAGEGEFTVDGEPATNEGIVGATEGLGTILIPGRNLQLVCHEGTVVEANFLNSKEVLGEVLFEECLVEKLGGGVIANCHVVGKEGNLHITSRFIALAVLHEGVLFVLFEPDVKNPLDPTALYTTVSFKSGTGCSLPLNNPIRGTVSAEVTTGLESSAPSIDFSEKVQALTGDKLTYGSSTAFLDGEATLESPGVEMLGVH